MQVRPMGRSKFSLILHDRCSASRSSRRSKPRQPPWANFHVIQHPSRKSALLPPSQCTYILIFYFISPSSRATGTLRDISPLILVEVDPEKIATRYWQAYIHSTWMLGVMQPPSNPALTRRFPISKSISTLSGAYIVSTPVLLLPVGSQLVDILKILITTAM